jgi:hypothetical protein
MKDYSSGDERYFFATPAVQVLQCHGSRAFKIAASGRREPVLESSLRSMPILAALAFALQLAQRDKCAIRLLDCAAACLCSALRILLRILLQAQIPTASASNDWIIIVAVVVPTVVVLGIVAAVLIKYFTARREASMTKQMQSDLKAKEMQNIN